MTSGCSDFLILNLLLQPNFTRESDAETHSALRTERQAKMPLKLHFIYNFFKQQMTLLYEQSAKGTTYLPAELLSA